MVFVIKNKNDNYLCFVNNEITPINKKDLGIHKKFDIISFDNHQDAEDFVKENYNIENIEVEEINCESYSLPSHFWVQNLERIVQEKEGCSLAESFDKFIKKENEGKFLFSDLKEIINNMTEDELNKPVNIEVMGPMTYEQHNIVFTEGRTMELAGKTVKSTNDCFILNSNNNLIVQDNSNSNSIAQLEKVDFTFPENTPMEPKCSPDDIKLT